MVGYRAKVYRAETKVLDGPTGRVEAVVSDESDDRDGDVIRQSGWELEDFNRHPVLLASHDYTSLRAQIGEWESLAVKNKRLIGLARYYIGEGNEEADWAFQLANKGRAAFSVGFIPLEVDVRKNGNEMFGPFEFIRQELLEISQVTIPSNRNALQHLAAKGTLHPAIDGLVREVLAENDEMDELISRIYDKVMLAIDPLFPNVSAKPYANEHACRLRDPGDFQEDSFRRIHREHEGKPYDSIMGRLTGETTMTEQAYRYPKDEWSASEARKHCTDHDGQEFEPAKALLMLAIGEGVRQGVVEALSNIRGGKI